MVTKKTAVKKDVQKVKPAVKSEAVLEEKKIIKDVETENEDIEVQDIVFDTKKKYFEAVGRRKNATARARLFTQTENGMEKGAVLVNDKPYQDYFRTAILQKMVVSPLEKLKCQDKFSFKVKVKGGGIAGQAGAVRHAITRTLILLNPYFKKRLKKSGFVTRDPRMRERKKPGLKRARRAPQWSKR